MKKLILSLLLAVSAHAAPPPASITGPLERVGIKYQIEAFVLGSSKAKYWLFQAHVAGAEFTLPVLEGVTLDQIKSSYLTLCYLIITEQETKKQNQTQIQE